MNNMTSLVSWFQLEYPHLVAKMRAATHHLTYQDKGYAIKSNRCHNDHPHSLNPYHLEGNIWEHTLLVCKQAENASYEVKIAALLHDIGKPSTRAVNPKNGRVSFYNHDAVGAFMALEILKREELGLSKTQQVHIFNLIALHTQIYKLSTEQLANIRDRDLVKNLIELGNADHSGRFHTAGDAVIPTMIEVYPETISGVSSLKRSAQEKEVVILCGLPASGKSTWVKNHEAFIVSRDKVIETYGEGGSYNEKWKNIDQKMVDKILQSKFRDAKYFDGKVIVDMTHMSKKSRRKSLSHFGPEYKKKCVMFLPDLPTIELRNNNRDGKVIDKAVIDKMMRDYYPPSLEEFDEIEYVL